MPIGIIATLKVQDGKGKPFEEAFGELAKSVRANEKGNKLYQLFKSRTDANTYIVMEIYENEAALEVHRNSDHFKAAGPKLAPNMGGRPEIQYFDAV